jgi:hypothetical protein
LLFSFRRTARVSGPVEPHRRGHFHRPAYAGRSPSCHAFGRIAVRLRLSWKSIANVMLRQFSIGIIGQQNGKRRGNAALFLPSVIKASDYAFCCGISDFEPSAWRPPWPRVGGRRSPVRLGGNIPPRPRLSSPRPAEADGSSTAGLPSTRRSRASISTTPKRCASSPREARPSRPPSRFPTGHPYAWVPGRSPRDLQAAECPGWLLAQLQAYPFQGDSAWSASSRAVERWAPRRVRLTSAGFLGPRLLLR